MMQRSLLLALLAVALTASCTSKSETDLAEANAAGKRLADNVAAMKTEPQPVPQTLFQDVTVPGTALQAKASGFADCTFDQRGDGEVLGCARGDAKVFGIPALAARVELDRSNHLIQRFDSAPVRPLPIAGTATLEDLSYGEVEYEFYSSPFDGKCTRTGRTLQQCRRDSSIWDVKEALARDGWLEIPNQPHGAALYLRRGTPLAAYIGQSRSEADRDALVIRPVDRNWAMALYLKARKAADAANARAIKAQALIDQMKDGPGGTSAAGGASP